MSPTPTFGLAPPLRSAVVVHATAKFVGVMTNDWGSRSALDLLTSRTGSRRSVRVSNVRVDRVSQLCVTQERAIRTQLYNNH
ncbi:hypothetical protein EVAR_80699_1 [Eumeta japonica]|uniref:Uncharacterized protein n=1 Tax=Eumeta variegata TaxID=151549 RepID=A0A4C1U3S5_EUMVA|nr:hypothetical protein EVAR_80699_1 [Eumeta japonica]